VPCLLDNQLFSREMCRSVRGQRAAFAVQLPPNTIEAAVFHLFASGPCNSAFASVPGCKSHCSKRTFRYKWRHVGCGETGCRRIGSLRPAPWPKRLRSFTCD